MARVVIQTENQKQRNLKLGEYVQSLTDLETSLLTKRPGPKKWSVLEIIEHMNIAHKAYEDKINSTLSRLSDANHSVNSVKASGIPSFLIKRFPPKHGKIKLKMKTFKRFQPVFELKDISKEEAQMVFSKFQDSINHIHETLHQYPSKNVTEIKFPSAIGPAVKFNLAEACEFVICHNERHVQQIVNTLKKVRNA